ncbi:MAG: PAS domain-containing sensor histidine kinase [Candidatus Geothermincolia bacterium]
MELCQSGDIPVAMDKKLRILMLDANPTEASAIGKELTRAGISFTTERVDSKQQFEQSMREFDPDLILSDYWLPSFDGISALAMSLEYLPDVPFIFVSGALGEELAIDAMKNGATDYVLKVGLSRLVPAVRRALRESEERAERKRAEGKLRESEERLKTILGSISTGVVIIDPKAHRIVDANPAAVEMIGFPLEGIVGQTCHKFMCPAEKGKCPITDLGQELDREERELLTASGPPRPVLKTVTRVILDGREHLLESFMDISERRSMEKALRESEGAAQAILNVPVGSFAIIDPGGVLLAINESGAERLGKKADELVGKRIFDFMPTDVGSIQARKVKEVARTGKSARFEDVRDGHFFENSLFPLFDDREKVTRIVVFGQDITERKQVEIAQKKDRDFISKVLDTAGALVMVVEREGRILLFNRTAEHVSGYSFAEVRGKKPWDIFMPAVAREARASFKDIISGKDVGPWQLVARTKSGEKRNVAGSHSTLVGADGDAEYVIITATDVTESRLAGVALKESEERYRTVFESTGTAMCIIDSEATITFLNDEFERICGHKRHEIVGEKKLVEFLDEERAAAVTEYCAGFSRGATRKKTPLHFECSFRPRSGKELKMLANMGLLPGTGAGTSAVSLIDVTREKAYEQDLRERAERLRDFLVVASHELRHPIAIVKGYANTLTEYMERMPPDLVQEILRDIDLSTDRLTRYVEQLLDVSRVEQGRLFINREPSDPDILLKMALDDSRVMGLPNKFVTRVGAGTGPIQVDAEKFVQLIHILVDNAAKFSPPDSPIEIEVDRKNSSVEVSVLDRGNGIPKPARRKVFDRFYQVEDALHHSKPGMGLGLYIASQIVDAHGGRIWVEPRDGGGSVFRFTIK